jgi:hypothetical protein
MDGVEDGSKSLRQCMGSFKGCTTFVNRCKQTPRELEAGETAMSSHCGLEAWWGLGTSNNQGACRVCTEHRMYSVRKRSMVAIKRYSAIVCDVLCVADYLVSRVAVHIPHSLKMFRAPVFLGRTGTTSRAPTNSAHVMLSISDLS